MKQQQGLGTEQARERADHDGDGIADQAELDFKEAGHTQPQPADAHPVRDPEKKSSDRHAR
jgi:hypothetical protein